MCCISDEIKRCAIVIKRVNVLQICKCIWCSCTSSCLKFRSLKHHPSSTSRKLWDWEMAVTAVRSCGGWDSRFAQFLQVLFLAASVCESVHLSAENLKNHWLDIDVTWQEYVPRWPLEVFGSWWRSTFDLENYFRTFSIQAIYFEWLDLANSFSVSRHIFRISRSGFRFKVMGQG